MRMFEGNPLQGSPLYPASVRLGTYLLCAVGSGLEEMLCWDVITISIRCRAVPNTSCLINHTPCTTLVTQHAVVTW